MNILEDIDNLIDITENKFTDWVMDKGIGTISKNISSLGKRTLNLTSRLTGKPLTSRLNPLYHTPTERARRNIANKIRAQRKLRTTSEHPEEIRNKLTELRNKAKELKNDNIKAANTFSRKYSQAVRDPNSLASAAAPAVSDKIKDIGNKFNQHYTASRQSGSNIKQAINDATNKIKDEVKAQDLASDIGNLLKTPVNQKTEVKAKLTKGQKALIGLGALGTVNSAVGMYKDRDGTFFEKYIK
jgi:dsDNA-specific endonuclease/ATPase MutS2